MTLTQIYFTILIIVIDWLFFIADFISSILIDESLLDEFKVEYAFLSYTMQRIDRRPNCQKQCRHKKSIFNTWIHQWVVEHTGAHETPRCTFHLLLSWLNRGDGIVLDWIGFVCLRSKHQRCVMLLCWYFIYMVCGISCASGCICDWNSTRICQIHHCQILKFLFRGICAFWTNDVQSRSYTGCKK